MSKRGRHAQRRTRYEEDDFGGGGGGRQPQQQRFRDNVVVNAKTQGQKRYIIEVKNNDITFAFGPAGCGKTAIAVGLALQSLMSPTPAYDKLVVLRPAKEACDEKIGFLPGDMEEKMAPWAAPIMDNMSVFIESSAIKNLFWQKKIEIIPLAYARGRSLNRSFIIVDEAQNCTAKQMLMVLTRLGEGSKMVVNGDVSQSDVRSKINGMAEAAARLDGMEGVSIVELGPDDIVRHRLISEIIKRFSEPAPEEENGEGTEA